MKPTWAIFELLQTWCGVKEIRINLFRPHSIYDYVLINFIQPWIWLLLYHIFFKVKKWMLSKCVTYSQNHIGKAGIQIQIIDKMHRLFRHLHTYKNMGYITMWPKYGILLLSFANYFQYLWLFCKYIWIIEITKHILKDCFSSFLSASTFFS